jgi:hypothetical protein
MGKTWWLLFITALLAVWNAGIVWFTQIAVYPLWPLVGTQQFHDYHLTWWHDMWPSFGPVVLMLACSVMLLRSRPAGVSRVALWLGVLLQVTVHVLTASFWAPIQATMATANGMSAVKYHELMSTHWLRVAFFVVYAVLMVSVFHSFNSAARMKKVNGEIAAARG